MGLLLSICFKSQAETGGPAHQVKRQRAAASKAPARPKGKQMLLGDRREPHGPGYNSTGPASPKFFMDRDSDQGERQRSNWGRPGPPSSGPAYAEHESAPGAFMTPPPSPRDDKRPPHLSAGSRSFSLKVPGKDGQNGSRGSKGKPSFRRSATTRR